MRANPFHLRSRPARVMLQLAAMVAAACFMAGERAAQAQGGSGGGASGGSSSSGSGAGQAPFPACVDDFADCTAEGAGWDHKQNRELSNAFNKNDWRGVQDKISDFLDGLKCTRVPRKIACPPDEATTRPTTTEGKLRDLVTDRAYLSVLFLDETLPVPTTARVVVHRYSGHWKCIDPKDSDLPEVYSARIGAYRFYDVRLLPPGVLAISQYNASPSPNALITSVPGALSQAAGKIAIPGVSPGGGPASPSGTTVTAMALIDRSLLGFVAKIAGPPGQRPEPPPAGQQPPETKEPPLECAMPLALALPAPAPPAPALPRPAAACAPAPPTSDEISTAFLVRRIAVPPSFKKHIPFIVPSVIPTVSITDQLTFDAALESYMIEAQDQRAACLDDDLAVRKKLTVTGRPMTHIERRLFTAYTRCRATFTVGVTTDLESYAAEETPILVARVRFPLANASLARLLQVHLQVTGPSDCTGCPYNVYQSLPPLSSGPGSSVCAKLPINLPPGQYKVRAEVIEAETDTTEPVSNFVAAANTVFSVIKGTHDVSSAPSSSNSSDALSLSDNSVAWGKLITACVTPPSGIPLERLQLRVLDIASGLDLVQPRKPLAPRKPPQGPPGCTAATAALDTLPIGVGDRLAVLEADTSGTGNWVILARAGFTVTEKTSSLAAASLPSGPSCLLLDPDLAAKINGSQAIASDFTDLYSTYAGLLTLAGATSTASSTPTQYTLGPLTRWAFSLGVGHLTGTFLHNPATAPADPATWISLDYHPAKFDETRYSQTVAERFRLFGGIALTPNFGLVAGSGIGLVRGLTLEGGVGAVLANVVTGPKQSGCTPSEDNGFMCAGAPTGRRVLGIVFVGLGYSFQ